MLALYIAAGVVAYSVGAGVMLAKGKLFQWDFDMPSAWFGLLLWPAVLPGAITYQFLTRPKRPALPTARVRDE